MKKILVVDDEPRICQLYTTALKNASYNVRSAISVVEGLKIALEFHPDIIISDYGMPNQNGAQFCRSIRDHDDIAATFFIIVTGSGNDELKREGLSKLFDDYIEKPVDLSYLVAKVNAIVRRMEKVRA
jgi:DNA-binding response OmpR family regulator